MNWFQWLNVAFQILGAVEELEGAIQAKQPFVTPPIYATLYGTKYGIVVNGTPQA